MPRLYFSFTMIAGLWSSALLGFDVSPSSIPSDFSGTVEMSPKRLQPGRTSTLRYRNDDWQGRPVYVHYGFNGWNLEFEEASSESDQGNKAYYRRLLMTWDEANGVFSTRLDIPEEARGLHFVFCRDACGSGQWDNNAGQDYAWPVTFPYIGPILTWSDATPSDSGVVISFESAVEGEGWIEFANIGDRVRLFRGQRGVSHSFTITGLMPATTYRYRVGVDRSFSSEQFSFRTTESHDRIQSASFIVMGDAQDNGDDGHFADVAAEITRNHADVDFIVSPGDLPWNDRPGDWWTFFDKGRDIFSHKVFMPVIGNHDTPGNGSHPDARNFMRYFRLPYLSQQEPYYSFSLFNMKFFMLSSEHPASLTRGGEQYDWLASELRQWREFQHHTADQRTFWTFVSWHIPPYNAGTRHMGQQFSFRDTAQLFQSKVDWFFGGHEHLYQRSHPLVFQPWGLQRLERYDTMEGSGTGIIVVPPMGAYPGRQVVDGEDEATRNIRDLLAFPNLSERQTEAASLQGFVRIDIEGNVMNLRTYATEDATRPDYQVVDEVSYSKARISR